MNFIFEYEGQKIIDFNEVYRIKIKEYIDALKENYYYQDRIEIELYKKIVELKKENILNFNILTSLVFADAYKILNQLLKTNNITDEELELFNLLKTVDSIEYLTSNIDNGTISLLLEYSLKYYESSQLFKIECLYNLDEEDNEKISSINLSHTLELKRYKQDLKCEDLMDIKKDMILKNNKKNRISDYNIEDNILEMITSFIKNLYILNPNNFYSLFRDIIKTNYEWNKYIIDHTDYDITNTFEYNIVKKIEEYDFELLARYAIRDYTFLKELIDNYFYYNEEKTEQYSYKDELISFTESDIKKYTKNYSNNIKQKLDIKCD